MGIVTNATFPEQFEQLQNEVGKSATVVIDVETNGLDSFGKNQICGIGIGGTDLKGVLQYYPFRHHQGENLSTDNLKQLINYLNSDIHTFIGYNLKFDLHFLNREGLDVTDKKLIDVIVMVRLLAHSEEKSFDLTTIGRKNYGDNAVQYDLDMKKILGENKWKKDFSLAPPETLGEYCRQDVYLTTRLYLDYLRKINRTNQNEVYELECKLTSVLYKMESRGVAVDKKYAELTQHAIDSRLEEVIKEIHDLTEPEFNISSPAQIGKVFRAMGISSPVKTPKGNESWNEAALVNINHRAAGLIRQYRTLEKLKSTYVEPYLSSDIMHTSFCNWGTATGRLSSKNPNLQNIPRNHFKLQESDLTDDDAEIVKQKIAAMVGAKGITITNELDKPVLKAWTFIGDESYDNTDKAQIAIRRLFIPRPDYELIGFDYSQMEVRVFMSYFRNEVINALLNQKDVDFHGEAAKLAFNTNEEDSQFKFYRQMAKAITFGTIYGIGNNRLAQQLGTTPEQAGEYKERYFEGLEGSKEFFDKVIEIVKDRGWIKNMYGRRYRISSKEAYKGVNYLVQGTSADILSERMIIIDEYLKKFKSNILLQVHDEIICEIHKSELATVPFEIRDLLEQNSLDIPLSVDMEICTPSWATKKDFNVFEIDDGIDWEPASILDSEDIDWT